MRPKSSHHRNLVNWFIYKCQEKRRETGVVSWALLKRLINSRSNCSLICMFESNKMPYNFTTPRHFEHVKEPVAIHPGFQLMLKTALQNHSRNGVLLMSSQLTSSKYPFTLIHSIHVSTIYRCNWLTTFILVFKDQFLYCHESLSFFCS